MRTDRIRWERAHDPRIDHRKVMAQSSSHVANIYHHLQWQHAEMIFATGHLRLSPLRSNVSTSVGPSWSDPYEAWWCEGLFNPSSPLRDFHAYAMCWTRSSFDEPAWRFFGYGKAQPMVRLNLDFSSLVDVAISQLDILPGSWFVGPMRYSRQGQIQALADRVEERRSAPDPVKEVSRTAAELISHKRNAFRFEREVRLLYLEKGPPRDALFLPMNSARVLDIMVSPYATDADFETVAERLKPSGACPVAQGRSRNPDGLPILERRA